MLQWLLRLDKEEKEEEESDLRLYSDDQKIYMQLWSTTTRHREYIGGLYSSSRKGRQVEGGQEQDKLRS